MTAVKVFHTQRDGSASLVANVKIPHTITGLLERLEYAYVSTQNIQGSWSRGEKFEDGEENLDYNPNVEVLAPLHVEDGKTYGLRSSMSEDTFELDGKTYTCEFIGFSHVGVKVR